MPILLGTLKVDINNVYIIDEKYSLGYIENIYINDDVNITYLEIYHNLLTVPEGYSKFFYKVCYYYF